MNVLNQLALLATTFALILAAGCNKRPSAETQTPPTDAVVEIDSSPATDDSVDSEGVETHPLRILHWNIESGGSDPQVIARQLKEFADAGYHILALSEVHHHQVYRDQIESDEGERRWQSILAESGKNDEREDDRLMIFYDSQRLELLKSQELNRYRDHVLNAGRHRSPYLAVFECRKTQQSFHLLHNHLARGDEKFRRQQAAGLREFARDRDEPIIAVGDYNFDFVFETRQGNPAFVEFMRDGIWHWVEPEELIDTNWFDPEPDGIDNYPGSLLDFSFVAGPARDWTTYSRVVVKPGDFPDDESTSDHRPVEVVVHLPMAPTEDAE